MSIHIRYFASLRDRIGRAEDRLNGEPALSVADVWTRLHPAQPMPPNTLAAINEEYAPTDALVHDGDELAFFPPVTGG